jgi:SnoaL-like domain
MKILTFIILSMTFLTGCTTHDDTVKKNTALIQKYVKAVEYLDYETMEALLDDDYIGYGPDYGAEIGKAAAIESWKRNVAELYDKIEYQKSINAAVTITSGDGQGEWVSNWAELNIVYKDGRGSVTIWANTIYQIVNEKIVKSFTFYNEADALRQLGYVFINPDNL